MTTPIPAPWLRPPVTTVYRTPRARLAHARRRFLTSPFVAHLRSSARAAFWPASIGCGVVLALVVLVQLQALTPVTAIR